MAIALLFDEAIGDYVTFPTTKKDFILEWADRWCHLGELIFDYLRTDDTSRSPSQPGELDQASYKYLRFWFIDNEIIFLPLWHDYCNSKDWTLDTSNDLIKEIEDAKKVLENPFFAFYGPEDLNILFRAYVLDKQSGQPDEGKAWEVAMNLLTLDGMAAEFVMEIGDRTRDTS